MPAPDPAPLDSDNRKLYPAADLPPGPPPWPPKEVTLAPPQFYVLVDGQHVPLNDQDIDRQIQVSILEELRGLRADLQTYHAAIFPQLIDIENAIANSSR